MFRVDKEEIIQDLNLKPFGSAGWFQDKDAEMPLLWKKKKMGYSF